MAHILIIDDDERTRQYLGGLLADEGHEILESKDGQEGLEMIKSARQRLIVLLDYLMPNFNGIDVLMAVRADPGLVHRHAIIIMTGVPHIKPYELALLMTAEDIPLLRKPFDLARLFEFVSDAETRLVDA